uniref:Galactose-3-O-sulfotransferase 2 n=1 Tax=Dromaius novaehollandiae TaxID=8790 RepID=A0A8C4P3K5_DRONO
DSLKIYFLSRHIKYLLFFNICLRLVFLSGFFHVNKSILSAELVTSLTPCCVKTNIMFLKTHKTTSSTILNILFQFTEKHNLTIALPADQLVHLGYPETFMTRFVEEFQTIGQNYNIMCNHLRFNHLEVRSVNTFYFSIPRNPVSQLESSYVYYKDAAPAFRTSRDVNEYLASPMDYYHKGNYKENIYAKNNMWFDFGCNNNAEDNESYIQAVLEKLEQNFHLVLIADYFDESRILLKHTLCWDLDDVVYFKLNSRMWCSLDWKLYLHFNQSFWKRIQETMGLDELEKEVNLLRARQKELMETCLSDQRPVEKTRVEDKALMPFQSEAANILSYNLNQDLDNRSLTAYQKMVMPELHYMSYFYALQHPHEKGK